MNPSQEILIPANFKPRPYQEELFKAMNNGIRWAVLQWHRQAGKDKTCYCFMATEAMRVPGNYYYVFPLLSDARRALWENVDGDGFRTIEHIPASVIKRKREDEMSMELINGSIIRLLGLDQPDKIRGISAKGVVFSEFAFQNPAGFAIFVPPLQRAKGWAIFNSTPNGKGHFYDLRKRVENMPDWYVSILQTRWPDKPNYTGLRDPEDLEHERVMMGFSHEYMDQEYGVSETSGLSGSYYLPALEIAKEQNRIGNFDVNLELGVDTFWDLGMSDSTAIWFVQYDGNRIILIDYYEDNNKTLQHYVNILRNKGYMYRDFYLPHDGRKTSMLTGTTTAQQLEDLLIQAGIGKHVTVTDKPARVQDGINKIRSLMSRMYFNEPKVYEGIKHLEQYKKKLNKLTGDFMDEPYHDVHSHAADALRTLAVAEITGYANKSKHNRQKFVIDKTFSSIFGDTR